MEKNDLWNVHSEKPKIKSSIEKIDDKNIISVNKPVKKIEIQKKPYSDANQAGLPIKIVEDEIQTSFSSNVVIKDPNKKPNSYAPKKKSTNIKLRINNKSPKPSNPRPIYSKDINLQAKSSENDQKIVFLSEIFKSIPRETIRKILAENFNLSEEELFELFSKLSIPKNIEKKDSSNNRNTEKPLNLKEYKKSLCIEQNNCKKPFCEFYHFEGERRRVFDNFMPKLCENKSCDNCEVCECAHTLTEIFYHESFYKKLSCPFQECPLQELCIYSHESKQQLSTLADKLNNEFEETLNKLELVKNKSARILSEINQATEEKKQLRSNLVCCCCDTYRITYCFSSCGHCVCTKCVSGYSQTYSCSKCNVQTRYIEIDYNYNKK